MKHDKQRKLEIDERNDKTTFKIIKRRTPWSQEVNNLLIKGR